MWEFMTILGDALRIATFLPRELAGRSPHRRPAGADRSPFARDERSALPQRGR